MKRYIISTGTVTYAIKGKDLLKRKGFKAKVERILSGAKSAGCGYAIILEGDITAAEAILRNSGIKIVDITQKND